MSFDCDRQVAHEHRTQLPVDRRHDGAHALSVGFADRLQGDQQVNARLDGDRVLDARTQAVKIVDRVDDGEIAELIAHLLEMRRRAGE